MAKEDAPKVKSTKSKDGKKEKKPKREGGGGGGGLTKPMILSDTLSKLLGETMLSRAETVKNLWQYIKLNDLQNPENKREILCDGKMEKVFGVKRMTMFEMNKLLSSHFTKPEE